MILVGILMAFKEFDAPEIAESFVKGTTVTLIGAMWMVALLRVGRLVLGVISRNVDTLTFVEPRTLPLFEMILKVAGVGGFLYFVCIAWNIPLTSWLASAGVIGIAVGFAAKDTLSNLFAGIFIVADAPYKVGDFVVLDNTTRGQVLEIGMRSTRLLTRDDVEITVPNAVIANSQIVNQTGGPREKMRVRVKVEAAYGSDVDQVEKRAARERRGGRTRLRRSGAAGSFPGLRRIGSGLRAPGVDRRAGLPRARAARPELECLQDLQRGRDRDSVREAGRLRQRDAQRRKLT